MRQFVGETEVDAEKTWPFEFDLELSYQANRLKAAVLVANKRLSERLASSGSSRRMGATLAAALMGPDRAVVTNVGDCRVYLLRDGALRQLTQDHSWVAEQVASGFLSEQTARMHPWRHMVTRAIQGDPQMPVDTLEIDLAPGDRLLLCSDGLHVVVTDDHMRDLLLAGGPLDEVCRALIAAGNAGGGPDNLSVIVIEFPGDQGATTH
jgi:protein phosphatase